MRYWKTTQINLINSFRFQYISLIFTMIFILDSWRQKALRKWWCTNHHCLCSSDQVLSCQCANVRYECDKRWIAKTFFVERDFGRLSLLDIIFGKFQLLKSPIFDENCFKVFVLIILLSRISNQLMNANRSHWH